MHAGQHCRGGQLQEADCRQRGRAEEAQVLHAPHQHQPPGINIQQQAHYKQMAGLVPGKPSNCTSKAGLSLSLLGPAPNS